MIPDGSIKISRYRFESFGGILSSTDPPFLAWVDKDYMRKLGLEGGDIWTRPDPGHLSAPTEVHFAVTNLCNMSCDNCYMSSGNSLRAELTTEELKKCLKKLSDMGVFHVALGGGEAFERSDFREIVEYCKETGLVPNLTTNGHNLSPENIETCSLMGQVNVSIDGLAGNYSVNGRSGDFKQVEQNIHEMIRAGVQVGINCVVSKKNFKLLDSIVSFAENLGLNEIEFLKYKPSGRGKNKYEEFSLPQNMIRNFYPWLVKKTNEVNVELKIDCSFIPAMVYHRPPPEELEKTAVTGCDGGNLLIGVKSNGEFSACSFVENEFKENISDIENLWDTSKHLARFRDWIKNVPEPCSTCDYLKICQGGCRAVALYKTGDFSIPDPECPFVWDYKHKAKRQ